MTRDPRPYNGLHLPSGAQAVSQGEQMKRAVAMEMHALTREIYVRAISRSFSEHHPEAPSILAMQELARASQMAARAFFTGLGVIEEADDPPEQDPG